MSTAWIRHPKTEAVIEVPTSAVPFHLQSDWVPLTDQEVADMHARQRDERRAVEVAMGKTVRTSPPPPPEQPKQPERSSSSPERKQPPTSPEREQSKPASARHKSGSSKENN